MSVYTPQPRLIGEITRATERQWEHWRAALDGDVKPTPPGYAASGFYRDRHGAAIAVWRDNSGDLFCLSTGRFQPKSAEQIDQAITGDGCRAITHEAYTARVETGRWPDDIEPRGIGDNSASLPPHEQIAEEIRDLSERFDAWLKSIGGKIACEEHDNKADNYAEAVGKLKAKAEATHKTEKAPWLEGGRVVDDAWKPLIARADTTKKMMLSLTLEFRKARDAEEKRRREAEIARQRSEQAQAVAQGEQPAPVSMPPPKPTGLRTVTRVRITDLSALAAQLAGFDEPHADFVAVCEKLARAMLTKGAQVNGAELYQDRIAS